MELTIDDLRRVRGGSVLNLELLKETTLTGVSTDSRSVRDGEIFFALKGERFDGHEFVEKAVSGGAALCVVEKAAAGRIKHPMLVVSDTTKALGELASLYRAKFNIPVLAIGGSNGKTTTKEMVSAVLGSTFRVHRTEKNLNNHIGVPLTLFGLRKEHEAAVVEIGTNHPGEIALLCRILDPTHGLITNVGKEHLEFFRTVRRVAAEEGALFAYLRRSGKGTAIVNADDPWVFSAAHGIRRTWRYGFEARSVRVKGKLALPDARGCVGFSFAQRGGKTWTNVGLAVPGSHNTMNALAAATTGLALGVSPRRIRGALAQFGAVKERMQVLTVAGVTILNDTYNANPDSVIAALRTLASMTGSGKKIVALGDMKELGAFSDREHRNIGRVIADLGFEFLLTHGEQAKLINDNAAVRTKFHYDQKNVLSEYLFELASPGDIILVKGSRGMKMEDVVTFLQDRLVARARMPHRQQRAEA